MISIQGNLLLFVNSFTDSFFLRGNGWFEHIYKEHNIYAYLNFCIYIEKRDITECNGIEKYVKEMIEKKDISFIPQGEALALQND